ncbi:MAG: hypothetical protein HY306_00885 [Nitrosomonadales bacterium]|nr:hypothetical protein [Nitrosomonadales bacterium]
MAWVMDNPLATTNSPAQNEADQKLWEAEDLGGITEDNNRLPIPVVWLLLLTVLTAFAITFPLWGQRPTPAIYADYLKDMDKPEIQSITNDDEAIKKIVAMHQGGPNQAQLERHPITMNELRSLKPKIEELQKKGVDLRDYTVVGTEVVFANFEGNMRANGTRERFQPWWDMGYTIDIFYVCIFFLGVVGVVKRLPPSSWQPTHGAGH